MCFCECVSICWSSKEVLVALKLTGATTTRSPFFKALVSCNYKTYFSHTYLHTHERRIPHAVYLCTFETSYLQRVVQKGFLLPSSPQRCCCFVYRYEIDEQRWVPMTTTIKKKKTTRTMMRMDILLAYDACAPFPFLCY